MKSTTLVKKLPKRVGEIFKVVGGGTPTTKNPKFWKGPIPWITSADLDENLKINPRKSVSLEGIKSSATNLVPEGSIIVATRVGLGKVGIAGTQLCFSQDCQGVILDKKSCDSKYTAHQLKLRVQVFKHISRGTTIAGVTKKQLLDLPFDFPGLDEQRRVVENIENQYSKLDAGIVAFNRIKSNLKRYRASVLKAACEGKLVPTEAELAKREGRTYESGEKLLERILIERRKKWKGKGKYKEPAAPEKKNLPKLPEGWTWATMHQIGELNRGKSKHRPRDDARLYGGSYPFIQTGDVRKSGGKIREFSQTYSDFGLKQSRLWPEETLCITIAANIAETGVLQFSACFPDSIVGFIGESGTTTTRYVEYFIRTAKERLERFAPATAQKNINLDVLRKVAIPLPPLNEQERIVKEIDKQFSIIEELESVVEANLKRATRLRQSILHAAFSGKLTSGRTHATATA